MITLTGSQVFVVTHARLVLLQIIAELIQPLSPLTFQPPLGAHLPQATDDFTHLTMQDAQQALFHELKRGLTAFRTEQMGGLP